jgi:hypothetical protein
MNADQVCDLVTETRRQQNLPPRVEDAGVLARIAEFVSLAGGEGYPVNNSPSSIPTGPEGSPRRSRSTTIGKGAVGGTAGARAVGAVKANGIGTVSLNGRRTRSSLSSVPDADDLARSDGPVSAAKSHTRES